jgi:hypothetical protein
MAVAPWPYLAAQTRKDDANLLLCGKLPPGSVAIEGAQMGQKPGPVKEPAEQIVKEIRRAMGQKSSLPQPAFSVS